MKSINSADLVRYNANTRGTRTGDCTVRSISLAFNKDYREVKKILNDCLPKSGGRVYNSARNIEYTLLHAFNVPKSSMIDIRTQGVTVAEFADQHSTGTYLIGCHKSSNPPTYHIFGGHLVTIINGKIFDTWDSRDQYVCKYIKIDGAATGKDTQIVSLSSCLLTWLKGPNKSRWWDAAFKASLDRAIDKSRRLKKLAEDNNVDITINGDWGKISYSSFVFSIPMTFNLIISDYNISQSFSKTVKIQIRSSVEPNESAIEDYITTELDDKVSGIIWSIVKIAEDTIAGYKLTKDVENDNPVSGFWSSQDEKMFNTLPYWVRRLATSFYVNRWQSWGETAQEIRLKIKPLPNDPENKSGTLTFEADDKNMLLAMLEYYKKTGNYDEAYDIRYNY